MGSSQALCEAGARRSARRADPCNPFFCCTLSPSLRAPAVLLQSTQQVSTAAPWHRRQPPISSPSDRHQTILFSRAKSICTDQVTPSIPATGQESMTSCILPSPPRLVSIGSMLQVEALLMISNTSMLVALRAYHPSNGIHCSSSSRGDRNSKRNSSGTMPPAI